MHKPLYPVHHKRLLLHINTCGAPPLIRPVNEERAPFHQHHWGSLTSDHVRLWLFIAPMSLIHHMYLWTIVSCNISIFFIKRQKDDQWLIYTAHIETDPKCCTAHDQNQKWLTGKLLPNYKSKDSSNVSIKILEKSLEVCLEWKKYTILQY